jgi:hypothetical protein
MCVEPNSWLGVVVKYVGFKVQGHLGEAYNKKYMGRVVGTPCMCECSMHKWMWKNIFIVSETFLIFELSLFCQFVVIFERCNVSTHLVEKPWKYVLFLLDSLENKFGRA